jgi:hypothetical protein
VKKKENEEAIDVLLKSLEISFVTVVENHPDTVTLLKNLWFAYEGNRNYDKAIENYLRSLDITLKISGKNKPDLISTYKNIP